MANPKADDKIFGLPSIIKLPLRGTWNWRQGLLSVIQGFPQHCSLNGTASIGFLYWHNFPDHALQELVDICGVTNEFGPDVKNELSLLLC